MSKKNTNGIVTVNHDDNSNGNGESESIEGVDYVITSTGARVDFNSVSPTLIQKTQTAGILPPIPYREVDTAFGEKQKEELTADDLRNDEEKKQWKEYQEETKKVLEKRSTNFIRAIFSKGTKIDDSKIEEWKREQVEDWGWDVPTSPIDLKVEYIRTELVGHPEDEMLIITGVLGKSGIPEKELEDVRTMFRSSLRRGSADQAES